MSSLEGAGLLPSEKLGRSRAGRLVSWLYTQLAVMLLFVIFRADSLSDGFALIAAMFTGHAAADGLFTLRSLLTPAALVTLAAGLVFSGGLWQRAKEKLSSSHAAGIAASCLCLALYVLSVLSLSRGGFNPFIYFQF